MSNLRILYDNAADRAALTASSTAGALAVANLQTDTKSDVWRATAIAASIFATWPTAETIQAVALPFCNLSPTATMRVRATGETSVTNLFSHTERFDSSGWARTRCVISQNGYIAPDGSASAQVLTADGTGSAYAYQQKSLLASKTYSVSVFVKPVSGYLGVFQIHDFTDGGTVQVNFSTMVIGTFANFSAAQIQAVGNGWYRLSATLKPNSDGNKNIGVFNTSTAGSVAVWGAMLAEGGLSSYYPSVETFTGRTGTATYLDSDGVVKTAAAGVARTQYGGGATTLGKLLLEAAATNLVTASGTLTTGWAGGCSVTAVPGTTYRGIATYQSVAKTANTASEARTFSIGSVGAGAPFTMSLALRAGSVSAAAVGLFDTANSTWGAASESVGIILEGPGAISQGSGGIFYITGLSATVDTVVQVTRTFPAAGTGRVTIYPNTPTSTTIGDSVLATRVQAETGTYATSYIVTTTATVTRAADAWSSVAGMRPTGYMDTWQTYLYDSGAQLACPAPALRPRGWTAAQAASAYAYGGGAYARMWLPTALQATGLAVDIVDTNNLQGYIEAARLIVGPYWSPTYNASDASMTVVDTTELYRTDAGDQGANAGYQYRRVPISLSAMPAADRAAFANIVRNSRAAPILLSVFPESADLALERDHMVYGRRSKDSDVAVQYATAYSTTVEIEEI